MLVIVWFNVLYVHLTGKPTVIIVLDQEKTQHILSKFVESKG